MPDSTLLVAGIAAAAVIVTAVLQVSDLSRIKDQQEILKNLDPKSEQATQMSDAMNRTIRRHHNRIKQRRWALVEWALVLSSLATVWIAVNVQQRGDNGTVIAVPAIFVFAFALTRIWNK